MNRYALVVPHAECGHKTVATFNGPPTEAMIEAEMARPCIQCSAKYQIAVKCACGHWETAFCNDLAAATTELEECGKNPCSGCGAIFIRKNKEAAA